MSDARHLSILQNVRPQDIRNFCADVFRHVDGGLFTLDLPAHLAAKRFLEHAPGLWRLANLIPNR